LPACSDAPLGYPRRVLPPEPLRLGEYSLLEKLGQGGMAQVYRGERVGEAGFKKKVAVKRMLPAYRRDPSLLERFAAEARTNARLDHPNLVHVLDFGIDPEPYLIMEFVEGVTLAALLQRLVEGRQQLEISAACFLGAEAAQGLDHAHRKRDDDGNPLGIVHRDVSPQNVLLSNEGAVKVSDFGLVKAADNVVQTGSGVPIGKMSYMAPEQADHTPVDARADVFSLGIVVWEMLTMRTLMPPNDPARASQLLQACVFQPPSAFNPKVPPQLDRIVMRCLTKDPEQRTPSAQALSMQLREVLHELAPGYGREQLARLLSWAFSERGWTIDEPHETAAQPSPAERMSMMPQPPAAERMRASMETAQHAPAAMTTSGAHVIPAATASGNYPLPTVTRAHAVLPAPSDAPAHPAITGGHPALLAHADTVHDRAPPAATAVAPPRRSSGASLWWVVVVVALGLLAIGALIVAVLFVVVWRSADVPAPPPAVEEARAVAVPVPVAPGLWIATDVQPARVYLGERDLGVTPVHVIPEHLDGAPLVVVARGFQPQIVAADELSRAVHDGRGRHLLSLAPSTSPDQAVFVRHPRPAAVRLPEAATNLGSAPGLFIVPHGEEVLELVDGQNVLVVGVDGCSPDQLCVRQATPAASE
jgi:serine/threonine protein kinase